MFEGAPGASTIVKGPPMGDYDLVVSARLDERATDESYYGFYPLHRAEAPGPLLAIARQGQGWALECRDGAASESWPLPGCDPRAFQQFRFRKRGGRLAIHWEALALGEIAAPGEPTQVGLCAGGPAAFDLVRVTQLTAA